MDRRDLIHKGLWSVALLPFMNTHNPVIKETPTKKNKLCPHCGKEVAWRECVAIETTAHQFWQRNRTYEPAGLITFHTDGTKCAEELISFERLDEPIIHKDYLWED